MLCNSDVQGLEALQKIQDKIIKVKIYPSTPEIPNAVPIRAMSDDGEVGVLLCKGEFVTSVSPEELYHLYATPKLAASNVSSQSGPVKEAARLNPPPCVNGGVLQKNNT